MGKRLVNKSYTILIEVEGQPVSKVISLDKNVKQVHGIQLTSDQPKLLYYRGSQRIEISGDELEEENFESKMLMSGQGVAPDNRYKTYGDVVAGNGEVKIAYKDTFNPNAVFTPYRVTFNFLCEMK
jgi:hypothetical protein